MKKKFLFIFILFPLALHSQYFHFSQHEVSTDLLRMNPTSIFRHNNELLFIGTKEGIIVFDGKKHDILQRNDKGSQEASSYFFDGQFIWVGFADGGIFLVENYKLKPWIIQEGWPKVKITGICKDKDGQMWFSTYGEGLYVYSHGTLYNINQDDGLKNNDIYSIVSDANGNIYAGTDNGLISCHFENEKKTISKPISGNSIPDDIITALYMDAGSNKMYAGTFENGLWVHDLQNNTNQQLFKQTGQIKKIQISPFGIMILVDNKTNPLLYFPENNQSVLPFNASGNESPLSLIDILCDREGNIWLLCNNNGLISAPGNFNITETKIKNIQSVLQIKDDIFIGNDEGLFCIHNNTALSTILKKENILSLFYNVSKDEIWAGTFGNGIKIINRQGKLIQTLNENTGLSNNNIFCMAEWKGAVWASTLAGLNKISPEGKVIKKLSKKTGLPTDYNYTIFTDKSNNLWIGTDGKGIAVMDSNENISHILKDQTVISFAEDKNSHIWFSTLNNGLGKIEKDTIMRFGLEDGLTEVHIAGITSDIEGNIISFHHTGLDIINPDTYTVTCIGNNAGIRKWEQNINPFSNNHINPIIITEGSKLITFQSVNKTFLKSKLIIKNAMSGSTVLNQSIENMIQYEDNDFLIEYAGLWFSDPDAVQYRYKMTGVDTEWRYTKDQKLIYPNLPPGSYTFILECAASTTFSGVDRWEIKLKIKPAFWQSWWFYFILGVVFLYAVYIWSEARNRRQKQMEEIKMEQVRSQLETLKSQINPHFLFNSFNTLVSIIESKPEQAVIFVEKLSDFYRNMLQYRDKDLIDLHEELDIHQNYSFLLSQRFGQTVIIKMSIIDTNWQIIPLTLQILTENAVKHNVASKSKPLIINISQQMENLVVANNVQPRINPEKSTHFGLQSLVKRHLNITGKEIIIQKNEHSFMVTIPLVKNKV